MAGIHVNVLKRSQWPEFVTELANRFTKDNFTHVLSPSQVSLQYRPEQNQEADSIL